MKMVIYDNKTFNEYNVTSKKNYNSYVQNARRFIVSKRKNGQQRKLYLIIADILNANKTILKLFNSRNAAPPRRAKTATLYLMKTSQTKKTKGGV